MYYFYPGKGVWSTPFPGGSHEFLDNGARLLDARAMFHFYATGITPAMTSKMVGKGSQYAMCYFDSNGDALDGSKTYKVHLPPNVPCKDFWSFTLYDNQTRAELQTDQQFPGVSSVDEKLQQNFLSGGVVSAITVKVVSKISVLNDTSVAIIVTLYSPMWFRLCVVR